MTRPSIRRPASPTAPRRLAAGLTAAVLLAGGLAGCTHASENSGGGAASGASASASAVDLSSVTKDAAAAALVPQTISSKGTWTIASDTAYAPAESLETRDGKQVAVGFDIDLITAIGNKLGLKTDVKTAEFDTILGGIGAKYDASISSFIINQKRLEAVDMVSYFRGGSALATVKGNPKGLNLTNLCGHNIGVQTGSAQQTKDLPGFSDACVKAGKPKINAVMYPQQDQVTTALIGGKLDGMLEGTTAMGYSVLKTNGAIEQVGDAYNHDTTGIVVPKGSDLGKAVQKALQALIDDGTYGRIMTKWGQQSGEITTAELNPNTGA